MKKQINDLLLKMQTGENCRGETANHLLNLFDVSRELKPDTEEKKTKFRQSLKFTDDIEQFYYDGARHMMKDKGNNAILNFLENEFPLIPESSLKISKERFKKILEIAHKDYWDLMLDPMGFKRGF